MLSNNQNHTIPISADFLENELSIIIKPEQKLSDIDTDITALPSEVEEQVIVKDCLYCLIAANGSILYCCPHRHV
jgi:hypothetical protein